MVVTPSSTARAARGHGERGPNSSQPDENERRRRRRPTGRAARYATVTWRGVRLRTDPHLAALVTPALDLYADTAMSVKRVAREIGVKPTTLRRWLGAVGLDGDRRPYTRVTDEERHQWQALADAGYSTTEIGRMFNRPNSTVGRHIRTLSRDDGSRQAGWKRVHRQVLGAGRRHYLGWSPRDVAAWAGEPRTTVARWIRRYYQRLGVAGWQRRGVRRSTAWTPAGDPDSPVNLDRIRRFEVAAARRRRPLSLLDMPRPVVTALKANGLFLPEGHRTPRRRAA